mmetsp:Transcript_47799/g.76610  ORF Transcript_47799/g.76610 Transcript_47799/m.76610 type:complete len:258 (+) Transcript_47799:85-858(+)
MGSKISSNKKVNQKQYEEFLRKLNREQSANGLDEDLELILADPRRLVFVSLSGLFRSYKQTPMILLYPAIFVLPIKRAWLDGKVRDEFTDTFIGLQDPAELEQFLHLLRWKDSQKLLFCQLDALDSDAVPSSGQGMIASFWRDFSDRLVSLKLNALKLDDASIWKVGKRSASAFQSAYNTTSLAVMTELMCLTMKYAPMQHIIYESNPSTLKPIVSYSVPTSTRSESDTPSAAFLPFKLNGSDDSVWYISTDYENDE